MMEADSIKKFYDLRGCRALGSDRGSELKGYLRAPHDFVIAFIAFVIATSKINFPVALDLCCGTGLHSLELVKIGYNVLGLDISPKSIQAAEQYVRHNNATSQACFTVYDVNGVLSYNKDTFDLLFLSGSLYYLDVENVIRECKRVLKSDGAFVFIETSGDAFFMSLWRHLKSKFIDYRDEQTLNHLLRRSQFERILQTFPGATIRYFDCFTLAGVLFKKLPWLAEKWHRIAVPLDNFLLNRLGLYRLGFKCVIYGKMNGDE